MRNCWYRKFYREYWKSHQVWKIFHNRTLKWFQIPQNTAKSPKIATKFLINTNWEELISALFPLFSRKPYFCPLLRGNTLWKSGTQHSLSYISKMTFIFMRVELHPTMCMGQKNEINTDGHQRNVILSFPAIEVPKIFLLLVLWFHIIMELYKIKTGNPL